MSDEPDFSRRFAERRTSAPTDDATPPAADLLAAELERIEKRIERVIGDGRDAFADGSDSYDHATVAILRLAALFEERRFQPLLASTTPEERQGITATRNIAAHIGYASMREQTFWETTTILVPAFVERIRRANGL